ncbi:hypothetical protein BSL78_27280 [Apostichopus japonicus]|uniref:Reverse transcriptase/retrotransposon-derived protein RNase H-like domain-containing protein n=1 Tax=Stichopus japonicus TaxID=307972 RepID=A0A2G8JJJ4_STIJA|nr:hypothetical protein BSL78_27280 [Apostichopus japonicus]
MLRELHPQSKVEAIINAPSPTNQQELHSLCGLISYYRQFLPSLAAVMAPLNELKGDKTFVWTQECETALNEVKQLLSSSKVLVHYDPRGELHLATDASPRGVGAVISHIIDGVERPIAYASRSLTQAERNYSQLEREALAIIFATKRFSPVFVCMQIYLADRQQAIKLNLWA